jgi:GTP 3',8-cyclase
LTNYSLMGMKKTLCDRFGRRIDTVRISVTDRCNLRCIYCMPRERARPRDCSGVLSFEEIVKLAECLAGLGVSRIKLTGGEPLLRRKIDSLVGKLRAVPGIEEISLTTNGILLPPLLGPLKRAGIGRVNISLDTLQRGKFRLITGSDRFDEVMGAVARALEAGAFPVKLNVVLLKNINDDEIIDFLKFSCVNNVIVRFIEFMPTCSSLSADWGKYSVPCRKVIEAAEKVFEIFPVEEKFGSGPARYFKIFPGGAYFGVITPVSDPFCASCSRLRVDSGGNLISCLHSEESFNVRETLRESRAEDMEDIIRRFVGGREFSRLPAAGEINAQTLMHSVGG